MKRIATVFSYLIGASTLLMTAASSAVENPHLYTGVNEPHLGWQKPDQREIVVGNMRRAGVKSVRISLAPPYDQSIDSIDLLARDGLSALMVVEIAWPNLAGKNATQRPGRGEIHPAVPLSQLDPNFFREQFGPLWREIDHRHIHLAAVELGNEINWSAFNGDLKVLPPNGQARQGAPGSVALMDRDSYLRGLRAYVSALAIVKQLRDESAINRETKIISAGLASMTAAFAARVGAEYVDPNETLQTLKGYGLDALVDDYGLHSYPGISETPEQRTHEFETLISHCAAGPSGHPCWVTEWGIPQPKLSCPSDDAERARLVREMQERIASYAARKRIAGAYYFDWDNASSPYSIWRCGRLTDSGKILFAQ